MLSAWFNLASLAAESQQVIVLRMLKFGSCGPDVPAEAHLMVTEKISAAITASTRMVFGTSFDDVVSDYRRSVQANRDRLSTPGQA